MNNSLQIKFDIEISDNRHGIHLKRKLENGDLINYGHAFSIR